LRRRRRAPRARSAGRLAGASRQLEASALRRRQRAALVLGGDGAAAGPAPGAGALGGRRHRSRPRPRARRRVARQQRDPPWPQDRPGAHLWPAVRAADSAAVHPRPGGRDHGAVGALLFVAPVPQPRAEDSIEDHFKYGSIGTEPTVGIPAALWRVLPIVFEDKLPKRPGTGWEKLGFV